MKVGKPFLVKTQMMLPGCYVVGVLLCFVRPFIIYVFVYFCIGMTLLVYLTRHMFSYATSIRPRLKKRYHNRLERVRGYLETIIDFDELISPQSLFLHFLGPEPLSQVQKNVEVIKKSK